MLTRPGMSQQTLNPSLTSLFKGTPQVDEKPLWVALLEFFQDQRDANSSAVGRESQLSELPQKNSAKLDKGQIKGGMCQKPLSFSSDLPFNLAPLLRESYLPRYRGFGACEPMSIPTMSIAHMRCLQSNIVMWTNAYPWKLMRSVPETLAVLGTVSAYADDAIA